MSDTRSPDLLAGFAFVDCLVLDLRVSPGLDELVLVLEAHLPLVPGAAREKAQVEVTCPAIASLRAVPSPGLGRDLATPVEQKANEVLALSAHVAEGGGALALRSDMLELEVTTREPPRLRVVR